MTKQKAARIMQLDVELKHQPWMGALLAYRAEASGRANGIEYIWCWTEGQAPRIVLKKLVEKNYQRVCSIVAVEQNHCCVNCGGFHPLQFHHKQRRSKGRLDTVENIEGLCQECHGTEHGERRPL